MDGPDARVGLRILDGSILLTGPGELATPWESLWKPFLSDVPDGSPSVKVRPTPWGYALRSPGRDLNVTDVWRALVESRNDAVRLGLQATTDVIDLHGAVMVRDQKALLLLGEMWSGKTTLALALVERGWRYFSDDLVVIECASGLVRPLPKPPGVKAYTWKEMRHHWDPVPAELGVPPGPFVIPPPFTGSLEDRAEPAWVVFLDYREGAEVEVVTMSRGEALAQAGSHLGETKPDVLGCLASVMSSCVAGVLTYGNARGAVDAVEGLLTQNT